MNWESIQQVIRIVMFAIGGFFLGEGITETAMFESAVGGVLSIGAFIWWRYWDGGKEHVDKSS